MAKLKIVRREKSAQPGSKVTGAKVEKVKSGKGQPGAAQGRFIGRTSGLSVTKFQNQSLETNRKRKLNDEQLALEWKREFPNAKADYSVETVRGVRNLLNKGKHGNNDGEPLADHLRVPEFIDGEPQPFWGEKTAAAKEAKASAAKTAPAAKKGKVILKKKKK